MSTLKYIQQGIRLVFKYWRIIFVFYAANLVLALLITLPLQTALGEIFGYSGLTPKLIPQIDLQYLYEFTREAPFVIPDLIQNMLYFAFIFWLLSTFLLGGTIKAYVRQHPGFGFSSFFSDCLNYFNRFLRLFLVWILFAGAVLIFILLVGYIFKKIVPASANEMLVFYLNLTRWSIFLFILILLNIFFDYTRINIVFEDESSVLSAIKRTFSFVSLNYWQVVLIYGTIFVFGLILVSFYCYFSKIFIVTTGVGVTIVVLFQQLYLFVRLSIKMMFYASQLSFYRASYSLRIKIS